MMGIILCSVLLVGAGELWFTEASENLKHRVQRGGGGDGGGWED